jgi:hypothetical protein
VDLQAAGQRLMHGTPIGDFEQPRSLIFREASNQFNIAIDTV